MWIELDLCLPNLESDINFAQKNVCQTSLNRPPEPRVRRVVGAFLPGLYQWKANASWWFQPVQNRNAWHHMTLNIASHFITRQILSFKLHEFHLPGSEATAQLLDNDCTLIPKRINGQAWQVWIRGKTRKLQWSRMIKAHYMSDMSQKNPIQVQSHGKSFHTHECHQPHSTCNPFRSGLKS